MRKHFVYVYFLSKGHAEPDAVSMGFHEHKYLYTVHLEFGVNLNKRNVL